LTELKSVLFMKIILAINNKGKNIAFVTDNQQFFLLEKIAKENLVRKFDNVHAVKNGNQIYLRMNHNKGRQDNISSLSISLTKLLYSLDDIRPALSLPAFKNYLTIYQESLKKQEENKKNFIIIEGYARTTKDKVKNKIVPYHREIFEVAAKFSIDPYLLAAIIIDEIARLSPLEDIFDLIKIYLFEKNTSIGIAQIKIDTARDLIINGYYNPNTQDKNLSKENIGKVPRSYIYKYLIEPKHSIFFAAAMIKSFIDNWEKIIDISNKPEILATLYSLPRRKPHKNPQSNSRGIQITTEFYQLAKEFIKGK